MVALTYIFRSWIFTASLVLSVGILGRSGRDLDEPCQSSITCLEHFATTDAQARQYSNIIQAVKKTILNYTDERNVRLQSQRKEASLHLFGLLSSETGSENANVELRSTHEVSSHLRPSELASDARGIDALNDWSISDADVFAVPWFTQNIDEGLQDFLQPGRQGPGGSLTDIPLFLMNDQTAGLSLPSQPSGH